MKSLVCAIGMALVLPHAAVRLPERLPARGSDLRQRILSSILGSRGLFTASAGVTVTISLSRLEDFEYKLNGPLPAPQSIELSSEGELHTAFTVAPDMPWIKVTPASGTTPQKLEVSVNPAGLGLGAQRGTLTVNAPAAINSPLRPSVNLNIRPGDLAVTPPALLFVYDPALDPPPSQPVSVSSGGVSANFTAAPANPWIVVTPASGRTPATVSIAVDADELAPGTYSGAVVFNASLTTGGSPMTARLPIGLTVKPGVIFQVSPASLGFSASAGGSPPQPAQLNLVTAARDISYSILASTLAGGSWLKVTPQSGMMPASLLVQADPKGLAPGKYSGTIGVTGTDSAGNSASKSVSVDLTVESSASFQVSPTAFAFRTKSGNAAGVEQQLFLTSAAPDNVFSISVATTDGAAWLKSNPLTGTIPAVIAVTVDAGGLRPGNYTGALTVASAKATPPERTIPVSLTVDPADTARLFVEPLALTFSGKRGSGKVAQQVTVANLGSGSFTYLTSVLAISGGDWLTVSPARGTISGGSPTILTVAADLGSLQPGTYRAAVSLLADNGDVAGIRVTATISETGQTVLLSQTGLTFTAVAGGAPVQPQTIGVLNPGGGAIGWTAASVTLAGIQDWLTVSPVAGALKSDALDVNFMTIGVKPEGLSEGDYYGQVWITAPEAENSPQTVTVQLKVLPPGSNPGPEVRPTGLIFTGTAASGGVEPQIVQIANPSGISSPYFTGRTDDGTPWFTPVPTRDVVEAAAQFSVQTDFRLLGSGIRRGAITLLFGDGSIRTVSLLAVAVSAATGLPNSGASQARAAGGCAPNYLLPEFTSLREGFVVGVLEAVDLQVKVVDDCGNPLGKAGGAVVVRFDNGDPVLNLVPLGNGIWSGTWQPKSTTQPRVNIVVTALLVQGSLRVAGQSKTLPGSIRLGATRPMVEPGRTVNAASFQAQPLVAPGSLISVFGRNLASSRDEAREAPYPTRLGDTEVLLAGQSLPLLYTSDGQLNAQVPYNLTENTIHQLVVRRGGEVSIPELLTVAQSHPAIFTKDQTGKGQGNILWADDSGKTFLAESGTPARVGQTIQIYCSGLGAVQTPVEAGVPVSDAVATVNSVSVSIGDVAADVISAVLSPGQPGLYQVTAVIPRGVPLGNQVPVTITVAGQTSPAVTMAIQ